MRLIALGDRCIRCTTEPSTTQTCSASRRRTIGIRERSGGGLLAQPTLIWSIP